MLTETEQSNIVEIKHLLDAQNELLTIGDIFTVVDNLSKRTAFSREQIFGIWKDFLARGREMGILDTVLAICTQQISGMNKIIELAQKGMDEIEQAGRIQDEEVTDIAFLQQTKKLENLINELNKTGDDNGTRD